MNRTPPSPSDAAFTLVELLLAIAVATLITVFLASMVNQTGVLWRNTTARIEQFRDARDGFEAITRRLSQATLNTYWDYYYPQGSSAPTLSGSTAITPIGYGRQSELRFISGSGLLDNTGANPAPRPTHSIFFQAPLGFVSSTGTYGGLANLLNTWGYYIEFNQNTTQPGFITSAVCPPRYRFRLMEMMQPSENLGLYAYTSGTDKYQPDTSNNTLYQTFAPPSGLTGHEWFTDAFTPVPPATLPPVHMLAQNIVALILLPRLSPESDPTNATPLCPNYTYDSTRTNDNNDPSVNDAIDWKNQLPPVVQVTMVAVDETTYNRIQHGSQMPNLGLKTLFQRSGDLSNPANPGFAQDLQTLQATLQGMRLNYRVFTTNVSIKAAKWSRAQSN